MSGYRVWAPRASQVEVAVAGDSHRMRPTGQDGWWQAHGPGPQHGQDYAFRLDGGDPLPDPRSPWQPAGVHGPSRHVDHGAFPWSDQSWTGRPLAGAVLYELHIGTFTPGGTFDTGIERLDHLAGLGVTHVEVMPVNAFGGDRGWGYDGVGLWAVQDSYGGPEGFKRFVDACHARGLAVLLDVVHNHLGPSGNYLDRFGPYFTDRHTTPWGPAVNLDGPGSDQVRRFVIDNALHWLRDYHLDGLRLDAVHALVDTRAVHLLEELAAEVDALATALGRPLSLIAESDLNDPRLVTERAAGGYGLTATWADDVHHALHALVSGERQGYYGDFGSLESVAATLTGAYLHDGRYSSFRARGHGRPVDRARVPGHRFVVCVQNHDQVGNRATGDRLGATVAPDLLKVAAALLLTSPFTPMLFMGEEWAASTPWQFFTGHPEPELAEAVRTGRRQEFAAHGWDAADVPDPQDPATRRRSVLDWSEPAAGGPAEMLAWYRRLVALRRTRPELSDPRLDRVRVEYDEAAGWLVVYRGALRVVANLAPRPARVPVGAVPAGVLAASAPGFAFDRDGVLLAGRSVAVVRTVQGDRPTTAPG